MARVRLVSILLGLVLALVSLPGSATAEVLFGVPGATGSFGEPVIFSTTFRSDEAPVRVELLSQQPGESGRYVEFARFEQVSDDVWRASATHGGHIVPNTRWVYRFRVVTEDGAVIGPAATHRLDDDRLEWQNLEGDRVNVWWHEGGDDFGRRALKIAEEALSSASALLGVADIEPVDFFIYADARDFRQAMGPATRENVGGQAHLSIRTLFGLIEPRQIRSDWVEELVTHELSHLVFHEAVDNPFQYPPRWLNEGLAVYLARGLSEGDRRQVRGAAGAGTIIPLEGLGGNFPTRPTRSGLAYAESVSAVDHFVETYGEERLVELITSFADGIGLDAAFVAATGEDFAAFDTAWLASQGAEPPRPFGPRESEPGPRPEAWTEEPSALLR